MGKISKSNITVLSRYDKCCVCVGQFGLQIFNLFDSLVGCLLFTFGIFLKVNLGFNDREVEWIGYITISLGCALIGISGLCFIGLISPGCRSGLLVSGYLSMICSLCCLSSAIAMAVGRSQFIDYIDDNAEELNLSNKETETVKTSFTILTFGLFYLFLSCIIRYQTCRKIYNSTVLMDTEFDRLLIDEEDMFDSSHQVKREHIESKYDNLRSFYRDKYTSRPAEGPGNKT